MTPEARQTLAETITPAGDDTGDVERGSWEGQRGEPGTHWGASPAHGGLIQHRGPRDRCTAPDCMDDDR